MRVFLDANVLFSAALGGEVFRLIWLLAERGRLELCTSPRCWLEAEFNLERKRPQAAPRLPLLMRQVHLTAEPEEGDSPTEESLNTLLASLPEKDRPVLQAALRARAQILLTGDLRHFGPLMQREDLPLRVLSPGDFIRQVRPGS
ncbi:PIN domain protein [Meiothermus luteus]|uniref:PIN domain protein n=1 Tax=Meiothermus luteus TaxID=2026184 RepID=A0A399EKU1_9DEIN|nr:PIN domain-containing protein [Meiothermus luteus]RIH84256.1 PIN domain protein [Meiothermus luteus]RIH84266.1 PIN domain protein [Meiothermus luteus]RMH57208.1 MAG: PIN domain-containing protein [Deinococcota bacterium]